MTDIYLDSDSCELPTSGVIIFADVDYKLPPEMNGKIEVPSRAVRCERRRRGKGACVG
jgi:hypothetical protein